MKELKLYLLTAMMFCIGYKAKAQISCDCNKTNQITVCYLTKEEYCSGYDGCQHSLDGAFMIDYLVPKLLNPKNYGPGGISKCKLNLKKIINLKSTKEINKANCDIFFVGSFAVDTISNNVNSDKTSVPTNVLKYIKTWSEECESNLVIVSQAEATPWGYTIENRNFNPNKAIVDPSKFNIFTGNFGGLVSFDQGGSYQGVITKTPTTGHEILAQDANKKPTVAFDLLTKDFILGDIGILCGQAGKLSYGPDVQLLNGNDVLAANIFSLACEISTGNKFTDEIVNICQGTPFTLPNGVVVNKEQVVADTFESANGCDSIHFYKVFLRDQEATNIFKTGCKGDSTRFVFDNAIFDETNPIGTGILKNAYGCDSLINVRLTFNENSKADYLFTPCQNSGFEFKVGFDTYNETKRSGITKIKNKIGCDSTVNVKLVFNQPDTTEIYFKRCIGDTVSFDNKDYLAGSIYSLKYDAINPCDSFVILTIDTFPSSKFKIPNEIELSMYEKFTFKNEIDNKVFEIKWDQLSGLSCTDCENPTFQVNEFPSTFVVNLKDLNNCEYRVDINAIYNCGPILPNAFAPNSASGNDKVSFYTPCPLDNFEANIFDRYGNKVFSAIDSSNAWDGSYNGQKLLPGVYTYKVNYRSNGRDRISYGNITLLR
jgi:gliding motility-associated-like protein